MFVLSISASTNRDRAFFFFFFFFLFFFGLPRFPSLLNFAILKGDPTDLLELHALHSLLTTRNSRLANRSILKALTALNRERSR